ncbi:helix-turn-helix domain-containing protein [Hahella sp. NBU794]|uniref:helix-turn-helix domain-containing protein n=1 Tax=Hahella sp. NBU794 TaxID=3422590 RepID=UPI003D6E5CD6
MKNCNELDIAEVAKLSGLPASTLRYYEEKGLIKSIGREGLKRIFRSTVIDQLGLISLGQYAGFSLDEIGAMFSHDGKPKIDRAQLIEKANKLDQLIQQMETMRDSIIHVVNCPEPNQLECPRFQTLIRSAARKRRHEGPVKSKPGRSQQGKGEKD